MNTVCGDIASGELTAMVPRLCSSMGRRICCERLRIFSASYMFCFLFYLFQAEDEKPQLCVKAELGFWQVAVLSEPSVTYAAYLARVPKLTEVSP